MLHLQVPHKRGTITVWKLKSSGLFGWSQVLSVESSLCEVQLASVFPANLLPPYPLQVPHKRGGNTVWKVKSSGVFGRSQVLSVESTKALRKGEALSMDYGPGKLDNTLLLDHGVLDTASAKVRRHKGILLGTDD
jgi:hypothetical protein